MDCNFLIDLIDFFKKRNKHQKNDDFYKIGEHLHKIRSPRNIYEDWNLSLGYITDKNTYIQNMDSN